MGLEQVADHAQLDSVLKAAGHTTGSVGSAFQRSTAPPTSFIPIRRRAAPT
jgi:hypothetical protein